jgi:hypothetical protein
MVNGAQKEVRMSNSNSGWRRPRVAVLAGGLAIVLATAGCGSGGGSSSTTQTSSPASAQTTPSTPASTPASTPPASSSSSDGALSGKWSGTYGGAYSGTFTLNWTESDSKLSGTIDLSTAGTSSVTGTVDGGSIKFGTVGGPAITYTGSVSGSSMSGSYNTPGGGGTWSAHQTS